jgi:uncharacterized protein (TIGR03382 family)
MRAHVFSVVALAVLATPALAAKKTALTIDPPAVARPRYSQAIEVVVHMTHATDGSAVDGQTECGGGQPCRVQVSIARASSPDESIFIGDPPVDSTGTASIRLGFVDNRYGDATFFADDEGEPYIIKARFLEVLRTPVFQECAQDAVEDDDGLCASEDTHDIALFSEIPAISLGVGLGVTEGDLGETLTLSAEVTDPTGDAPEGGTDLDGPAPILLEGVSVQFFYDQNNDGNPSLNEQIPGSPTVTNQAGVASLEFELNPEFVFAGVYESGIHAEFSGDDRFGVGRASVRLIVHPAAPDVAKTLIEATPEGVPADGNSQILLRARLVDTFNNVLDENSDPHEVTFTSELGTLLDTAQLDPLDGTYTQTLQASRKGGASTVQVFVDGVAGPTHTVSFEGGGCECANAGAALPLALVLLALSRRRRGLPPAKERS